MKAEIARSLSEFWEVRTPREKTLLMWGGRSRSEEHTTVTLFGWSLCGFIAAMIVVIIGLLAGGPVGRLKMSASRDGASIEADNS